MASARLVGINHVALEVGDVDAALEFYGRLFDFELRGRAPRMAFIDMGDQFVAISEGRTQPPDAQRHFGLVVDDKAAVRRALKEAGVEIGRAAGSTSTTRGATSSRSSTTARSSSARPSRCCAAWGSTGCARATARGVSFPTRASPPTSQIIDNPLGRVVAIHRLGARGRRGRNVSSQG